jgi:hypothetical protein
LYIAAIVSTVARTDILAEVYSQLLTGPATVVRSIVVQSSLGSSQ